MCGFESEEFKATFKWHRTNFRPDEKFDRTLHWHGTVQYIRSVLMELKSQVEFSRYPMHRANQNGVFFRYYAPCITSPFWYENLDGYRFQNVLNTFSTPPAKTLTTFLEFKFLNGEASKFLYDYGGTERTEHRNVRIFNQSKFRGPVLCLRSLNHFVRKEN